MPDYSQGKIYKLTAGDLTYYGSTSKLLNDRISQHKYDAKNNKNMSSQKLFESGSEVIIELIEDYPCKSKEELEKREGFYIRNFECVNEKIAGRTDKQWREDNKEIIFNKKKQYREDNREVILEKKKQYYENNREVILEKQKQYTEANREVILEKKKQYCKANKEAKAVYDNQYRKANKDRIKAYKNEKIECECGAMICRDSMTRHCNSLKHKKYIESL